MTLRINQTQLSATSGAYGIMAYVLTLLNFSPAVKNSKFEAFGYFTDSDPANCNPFQFDGFGTRAMLTDQSKDYHLVAPLWHGLAFQNRAIPSMVPLFLAFDLQDPKFVIKSGVATAATTNNDFIYEIKNPVLRVKRVKCIDSVVHRFEQELVRQTLKFPYLHYSIRSFIIPKGVRTINFHDVFGTSFLPRNAAVFLLPQDWVAGSFKSSPLNFTPNNIKEICFYANDSERIPSLPYNLDFSSNSKNYLHAFLSLFGNDGLMRDETNGIDMGFWSKHATIFMFWLMHVREHQSISILIYIFASLLFKWLGKRELVYEKKKNKKKKKVWNMYVTACRLREKERV